MRAPVGPVKTQWRLDIESDDPEDSNPARAGIKVSTPAETGGESTG